MGEYIGLVACGPAFFWICGTFGWRMLFAIDGTIGILFGLVWWFRYRDPHDCKTVNQAELDHIAAGGGLTPPSAQKAPFTWSNCRKLLRFRQIWGAALGNFAGNATLIFFLTWFPTYLSNERHMGWAKMGIFSALPFMAAAVGITVGGWASDRLLGKTGSLNVARKGPIITGLLLASSIVAANFVDSDAFIIAIMSAAFFGQGMVGLGWTLISDMAPKHLMGVTGGLFNFVANLSGVFTPIVIGVIINETGSFAGALYFIGAIALSGVLSYVFLLGRIERLAID